MNSRRSFFKQAAYGSIGIGLYSSRLPGYTPAQPLQLGIAGYTFTKVGMETAIAMMQRLGITNLSLKDNFLPLDSTVVRCREVIDQFKAAGITVYGVGVIYMKTLAEVDRAFDYAARTGVKLIIGAPEYSLLPYAETKVRSTGIRLAIHNHGPEDRLYPSPADVWGRISGMDKNIGLCIDIGHATRAGTKLSDAITLYQDRLFDLHIKDVSGAYKEAAATEIGRGVIDFPLMIKTLETINYTGKCSLEYEKDMTDPIPGLAESTGFFRGVIRAV